MDTRPFSPDVILTSIPALLPYLEVTLMVGLISVVTGSAFGLLLAWARLSGNRILSSLAEGYTYIIRCTPSIVLLFIVFYEASEEKRERDDDENRTRQIIEIDSQRIPCKDRQSVENDERKRPGLYDRAHRSPGQDESYHFPKLRRVRHRALCSVHADLLDGEYPS